MHVGRELRLSLLWGIKSFVWFALCGPPHVPSVRSARRATLTVPGKPHYSLPKPSSTVCFQSRLDAENSKDSQPWRGVAS